MRNVIAIFLTLALVGCAAPRAHTNQLELGMSKAEVTKLMGEPDSSSASAKKGDCYMYSLWRDFWNRRPGDYSDRYYACFSNDKLTSYGRVGDFTE